MAQLTFNKLRKANVKRLPLFKSRSGKPAHSEKDGSDWTDGDWVCAVVGELGELANLIKKRKRGDFDGNEKYNYEQEIADEIADVQTYLDLLAFRLGVDLGKATIDKFNRVSDRVGCNVKL